MRATPDLSLLTPILSKVLEDFVVSWMIEDVGEHIDSRQYGSLKGSSTTYCLLDLIHNWLSELDNPGCYLRACFLDFSKAFDRIDHTIVIRKLIDLGVCRCDLQFPNRSVVMCQTRAPIGSQFVLVSLKGPNWVLYFL